MAVNENNPLTQITTTSVICSSIAVLTTIYRLVIRRARLWTDDGCAIFSTCILLLQVASVFLHADMHASMKRSTRVAAYYLMYLLGFGLSSSSKRPLQSYHFLLHYLVSSFPFVSEKQTLSVRRSARLSILFSIIRIDPNGTRRRILLGVAFVFLSICLVLIAQLFWVCERKHGWKDAATPQCPLSRQVVIFQLISDVLSDTIIIVAPLQLLWHLEDKALRRRLCFIFSTCIVTTIVSLVHAALILTGGGPKVLVAAVVEVGLHSLHW
ncbi:hypothetical protein B0H11DRAFT_959951 [Mycena galericulata]|nr:hypothetical protein B0H11DRAFT_959951 [Mycena galericulata]